MAESTIESIYRLLSAISAVGVIFLTALQVFKRPLRAKTQETFDIADAASKAVQAAVTGFEARINQLAEQVERLEKELRERDAIIAEQAGMIEDLKDWGERLFGQVKEAGKEPVSFTRKKTTQQ